MPESSMQPANPSAIRRPVLLIVLDGFGYNSATEATVLERVKERLSPKLRRALVQAGEAAWEAIARSALRPDEALLVRLLLSPVFPTVALGDAYQSIPWATLRTAYLRAREALATTVCDGAPLLTAVEALVSEEALRARYTVWSAHTPYLDGLRNRFPTFATLASGRYAGYEDVDPPVQGNSETGHQQLSNFTVAAQTPLEISSDIADGSFFNNPVLVECLEEVTRRGTSLDLCFLLSGEYGDDGRVHSAWNHLQAVLEAAFLRAKLPPDRVRIEAILDGRDSPPNSSVEMAGNRGGFLYKLRDLLARYDATESLAWIIGRGLAMDRDYEETRAKLDFDLLVNGLGRRVDDIDAAIEAVKGYHDRGIADTSVPPILVGGEPRRIANGDVFLNLNFRADRQRGKTACLLGARDFLQREAGAKDRTWDLRWLRPPGNLAVYCLSEYHPDFAAKYGARILYPIRPQAHNLLAVLAQQSLAQGFPFHYLLTAESTKALHVGYFIRGRREQPEAPEEEQREIIASYGSEFGVATDDDYWKAPQMRAFALADFVVESLASRRFDLIALNLSNADMIGHLLPKRFDAAVRSLTLIDTALETIVASAQRQGYDTVITADHGNVEDDGSSHSTNPILTSFISPDDELRPRGDPREPARLFDIPWSIVEIMGLTDRIIPHLPPIPRKLKEQGLVGHSLVEMSAGA